MNDLHIGKKIENIIKDLDIKKVDFANDMGMTRSNLYKMLENSKVSTEILEKIHKLYNVPYSYFFCDDNSQNVNVRGDSNVVDNDMLNSNDDIMLLKKEVENLTNENTLLKELIKSKNELINQLKKNN